MMYYCSLIKFILFFNFRCGKSTFICSFIQNLDTITKSNPTKVIYIYKVWQPLFESMKQEGLVHLFLKDQENIVERLKVETVGENSLIIFDDLINSKHLDQISNLFVVDGRHSNYSMIFTSQKMFLNNEYFRLISSF